MDESDTVVRRKPGTRPKGPRTAITARVPKDHWAVYERIRLELGYSSLNDYVTAMLASAHELPVPEYAHPSPSNERDHRQDDLWRATG